MFDCTRATSGDLDYSFYTRGCSRCVYQGVYRPIGCAARCKYDSRFVEREAHMKIDDKTVRER